MGYTLPLPFSLAADVSPGAVSLLPPAPTRYMVNAAYMRMKNLTVSYTFDKKMLKALRLENSFTL